MPAGSGACAAAGGGARRAERQSERVVGLQETEETLIWASGLLLPIMPSLHGPSNKVRPTGCAVTLVRSFLLLTQPIRP